MKLTSLTINDLFSKDENLTFLVGAGCSVDAPSSLPAGRPMMEAIIKHVCSKSEFEKISKIEKLRFESLVEILRDKIDPDLKVIDFYGVCDKPNLQHYFLSEMINKGHFVLTTNFDFLIEIAMLDLEIPIDKIKIIVTKKDYEDNNDPSSLFKEGFKTLYKIHGSTQNFFDGKDHKDSLITTIQALGSNKEKLNIFQLEPYKCPLLENISKNRSLVIIGYSGNNDFDIIPTLRVLKNIQNFIWINHIKDDNNSEKIYEIEESDLKEAKTQDKTNQILIDIYQKNNSQHIYRVDVNTTRLVSSLIKANPPVSEEGFNESALEWLDKKLIIPKETLRYYFPFKIYRNFGMHNDALRVAEKMLSVAKKMKDLYEEGVANNMIGIIHKEKGDYSKALKYYEAALIIDEKLKDFNGKSTRYHNIGEIYLEQDNISKALDMFEKGIKLFEKMGRLDGKIKVINNIGILYEKKGDVDEALKKHNEALKLCDRLGDLMEKANTLKFIGDIYLKLDRTSIAIEQYEKALEILTKIGKTEFNIGKRIKKLLDSLKS